MFYIWSTKVWAVWESKEQESSCHPEDLYLWEEGGIAIRPYVGSFGEVSAYFD